MRQAEILTFQDVQNLHVLAASGLRNDSYIREKVHNPSLTHGLVL